MTSQLYVGQVAHARKQPVEYRFAYRTFSLKVDLDEIAQESQKLRWLSLNRFNLVSLNYKDHGARDGTPWRQWLEPGHYWCGGSVREPGGTRRRTDRQRGRGQSRFPREFRQTGAALV